MQNVPKYLFTLHSSTSRDRHQIWSKQYKPERRAALVTYDSLGSGQRSAHDDVTVRPGTETQLGMTLSGTTNTEKLYIARHHFKIFSS